MRVVHVCRPLIRLKATSMRRHLKISSFPVDRRAEIILRLYPAAFFFFFFFFFLNYEISAIFRPIFIQFSPFYRELSEDYIRKKIFRKKKRIPGRPGDLFLSHPVDRKQTFYLVWPDGHMEPQLSLNLPENPTGAGPFLNSCILSTFSKY